VPPTGSISYINNSTSSIHPVASKIEIRKEGKIGRVYYPAPYMTNDNLEYYEDAYEIGYEKIIDTYAAATQHVDQGLSLTLFFKDTATTRDINRSADLRMAKGIKTIYIRLRRWPRGTECKALHAVTFRFCVRLWAPPDRRARSTTDFKDSMTANSGCSPGSAINWNRIQMRRTSRCGTASSTTSGCREDPAVNDIQSWARSPR
jgi:hypothetical protein